KHVAMATKRKRDGLAWIWMKAFAEKGVEMGWNEDEMERQIRAVGEKMGVDNVRMAEAWMTELGRRHKELKEDKATEAMESVAKRFGIERTKQMKKVRQAHLGLVNGMRSREHRTVKWLYLVLVGRARGAAVMRREMWSMQQREVRIPE